MITILTDCPDCRRPHALTWWQGKSGKRKLGVFCDRQGGTRKHLSGSVFVERTEFIEVNIAPEHMPVAEALAELPTYFTPEARKAAALKGQDQLVMMNVHPGEAVERSVAFEGVQPSTEAQKQQDDATAARLLAEIEQRKKAQEEVNDQINSLVRKRTALEGQERELRAKLREVWTEPLELKP